MNALVKKEIRLLLPAWITAMLLVTAPILLGRLIDDNEPTGVTNMLTVFGLAMGCVLLGLAGMGREIATRTFSLLLAQPRPRGDFWRAKLSVLLVSLISLALFLSLVSWQFVPTGDGLDMALIWLLTACVAVTGALWTTLLFRQIIAAFWISVLLPFAILVCVLTLDDEVAAAKTRNTIAATLLAAYSVAGYFFARWQFRHAQDTAWTGGNLSLPSAAGWLPWKRTETVRQKMHPLRALLGKEFQFQQVSFLLAGLLLLVQIAVLLVQKFVNLNENSVLAMIVQHFWGMWIVMPLLVGCSAVAEERKLGTLEPQLCLPVSRAWQFAVKVFVTLVCGTVLGALVPVLVEVSNPGRGSNPMDFAAGWTLACICVAFVAFYASSLTQQLLQAIGAAIGIVVVGLFLANWFIGSFSRGRDAFSLFGATLWQGPLVLFVGAGVMFVFAMGHSWRRLRWFWAGLLVLVGVALWLGDIQAMLAGGLAAAYDGFKTITLIGVAAALCPVALTLALAAKNFKHAQTSLSLWWRNSATWLSCFVMTGIITTLVYNRVWELAMPFEPPAGAPRLSGSMRPVVTGGFFGEGPNFVLLPDGRLCSYRGDERVPAPIPSSGPDLRAIKNPPIEFLGGSNWVAVATTRRELVGVQSDGSLWRAAWSKRVDKAGNVAPFQTGSPREKGTTVLAMPLKLERFGSEFDWAKIAASWQHCVALKRDGTIWGWGDNSNQQLGDGPKFITNAPVQIGQATNWTAVYAGNGHSYAVNREGEIWKWGKFATDIYQRKMEEGPVKLNIKVPGVRSVSTGDNNLDLILDTDGNLWGLGLIPPALLGEGFGTEYFSEPRRLGGSNWLTVSCNWQALIGLKADGTLWLQRSHDFYSWPLPKLVQLGKRTDWIAVKSDWQEDLALSKDGTICRFGGMSSRHEIGLLAPTRRVTWSLNLLDAAK